MTLFILRINYTKYRRQVFLKFHKLGRWLLSIFLIFSLTSLIFDQILHEIQGSFEYSIVANLFNIRKILLPWRYVVGENLSQIFLSDHTVKNWLYVWLTLDGLSALNDLLDDTVLYLLTHQDCLQDVKRSTKQIKFDFLLRKVKTFAQSKLAVKIHPVPFFWR